MKTIFFDLTTSYHFSGNPTGIARVEQRAYRALLDLYGDRVVPIAWNSRSRNFLVLDQTEPLSGSTLTNLVRLEASGAAKKFDPSKVQSGDRMIIVGGAWISNIRFVIALLNIKKASLLTLTLLVHDLIHMRLSHIYPAEAVSNFTQNIERMTEIVDSFVCYSETSMRDLHQLLVDRSQTHKPIDRFYLGDMTDDLKADSAETSKARDIRLEFEGQKFVLYVSSIDIRKNHILLINVWRRLIETRGRKAPHLIFVGRTAWGGDDIVSLATREKSLMRNLHFLQDVDDASLHWLYRNCQFTVYPSLYEGWGLPIAESLGYGKASIVANRTSTAEVSPNLTIQLDPYDFSAWLSAVEKLIDDPKELLKLEKRISRSYKRHSWNEAVKQIVASAEILPALTTLPTGLPVINEPASTPPPAAQKSHVASLAAARAFLDVPDRLPSNRHVFRVLRMTGIDRLAIRLYRRTFNRTNESLRRVLDILQDRG